MGHAPVLRPDLLRHSHSDDGHSWVRACDKARARVSSVSEWVAVSRLRFERIVAGSPLNPSRSKAYWLFIFNCSGNGNGLSREMSSLRKVFVVNSEQHADSNVHHFAADAVLSNAVPHCQSVHADSLPSESVFRSIYLSDIWKSIRRVRFIITVFVCSL